MVDALGNPMGFHLTGGQACDLDGADGLLEEIAADTVLADKGYDADQRGIERLQRATTSWLKRFSVPSTWRLPSSGLIDDTP